MITIARDYILDMVSRKEFSEFCGNLILRMAVWNLYPTCCLTDTTQARNHYNNSSGKRFFIFAHGVVRRKKADALLSLFFQYNNSEHLKKTKWHLQMITPVEVSVLLCAAAVARLRWFMICSLILDGADFRVRTYIYRVSNIPVSYTHLTLPTIYSV